MSSKSVVFISACCLLSANTHAAAPQVIEEMVVIAHPLSSEGLAQPSTVVEGDALARNVAGTLGDTLVNQPGIHSSTFGQAVGRPVIHGLGGARVRIMEDRIDAMDASVSSPDHATTIEPFVAERIEVLKGPSTLLYGNGAIGGVVDVHTGRIPHRVPERFEARGELRAADNADRRTAVGVAKLGGGNFAFHIDGFLRDADNYEIPGFARSEALRTLDPTPEEVQDLLPGSHLETRGGAFGGSFIGPRGFIGAAISVFDARYGLPGGQDTEPGLPRDATPVLDMEQTRVDLEAALLEPFDGAESINFRVGSNRYRHVEIEPSGETGTTFDNDATDLRLELVHEPVGSVSGAGGVQFNRRDYAAIGEEAYVPPVESTGFGLFWVGERPFTIGDLAFGLRYEHVSRRPEFGRARSFDLLAVSAGLILPFENGWTVSAQLDRSGRAPAVEELFAAGPHLATLSYQQGDPTLDRETATNVSGTIQYENERFLAGATVYYTDFQDFIYELPTGVTIDELPVLQWTQADATFHGLDLEARWTMIRWTGGSGGKLDIRGFYDQVRARLSQGEQRDLPRIPPERYGLGLALNWGVFDATLTYARTEDQQKVAPFELPTAGFDDLRAYLGFRVPFDASELELFISGSNLTDTEQRHHTSFIKDLAPQPGRTIEGGVRLKL